MTLTEARELLGLGLRATRKEIKADYRREAHRWHPDRAPVGVEGEYRARMQKVNAAHHLLVKFIEDYRYHLVETEASDEEDYQRWWYSRFSPRAYGPPPQGSGEEER
jgi:DnaJ-class molecular chaperone